MPYPIDPIAASLYALSGPRMVKSMIYKGELWGIDPTPGVWDATKGDPSGNYIKLYTNVPLSIQPTKEFDSPGMFGRTEEINLLTLDNFYAHATQPIQDAWWFQCTSSGTGYYGLWWLILGNTQILDWHSKTQRVVAKRSKIPPAGWHV